MQQYVNSLNCIESLYLLLHFRITSAEATLSWYWTCYLCSHIKWWTVTLILICLYIGLGLACRDSDSAHAGLVTGLSCAVQTFHLNVPYSPQRLTDPKPRSVKHTNVSMIIKCNGNKCSNTQRRNSNWNQHSTEQQTATKRGAESNERNG